MTLTDLLVLGLAAWRLASLLVDEAGPFAVFARLRYRAGVRSVVTRDGQGNPTGSRVALNTVAEGLLCIKCMSVWASLLLLVPLAPVRFLRLVLAGSAVSILVHEVTEWLEK